MGATVAQSLIPRGKRVEERMSPDAANPLPCVAAPGFTFKVLMSRKPTLGLSEDLLHVVAGNGEPDADAASRHLILRGAE